MKKVIEVVLIGAGNRGETYTRLMGEMPEKYKVVAVAEPVESRRNEIKEVHQIPEERCFTNWEDLLAKGKIADLAIISTQDKMHYQPTMEAISLGYDILLEKPVSPSPKECLEIANHAKEKGVRVVVCHVLRYAPLFETVKSILDSGEIGEIISVNHEECVGNVHQSHSFVRGNWGNEEKSTFMLLAKSCHDMDMLQWITGKSCKKIQSFGALTYFTEKNAPQGAPDYCIEGCPQGETCPYNAVKLYLDDKENRWFRTTSTKEANPTDEIVEKTIRTTQYGKCVFKCDNDVVDHQTVNILMEDDVTIAFTMNAFNKGGRYLHVMGTAGELRASLDGDTPIEIYSFATKETRQIAAGGEDGVTKGHGGGDSGIVNALYEYLTGTYTGNSISDIEISVNNHLIVFAAEKSRREGIVVDFEEFKNEIMNN